MSFVPRAPGEIAALIHGHPLAWVASRDLDATLLPLIVECDAYGTPVALVGHYPRRNPQVAAFNRDPHALILFTGPAGTPASIIAALRNNEAIAVDGGTLHFMGTPDLDIEPDAEPEWLSAEQSNSSVVLGQRAVLKLLRKIQPGIHPEAEMVKYLTTNIVAVIFDLCCVFCEQVGIALVDVRVCTCPLLWTD